MIIQQFRPAMHVIVWNNIKMLYSFQKISKNKKCSFGLYGCAELECY